MMITHMMVGGPVQQPDQSWLNWFWATSPCQYCLAEYLAHQSNEQHGQATLLHSTKLYQHQHSLEDSTKPAVR